MSENPPETSELDDPQLLALACEDCPAVLAESTLAVEGAGSGEPDIAPPVGDDPDLPELRVTLGQGLLHPRPKRGTGELQDVDEGAGRRGRRDARRSRAT